MNVLYYINTNSFFPLLRVRLHGDVSASISASISAAVLRFFCPCGQSLHVHVLFMKCASPSSASNAAMEAARPAACAVAAVALASMISWTTTRIM